MSRHQGSSRRKKPSGRGQSKSGSNGGGRSRGRFKGKSYSRGNAPIKKVGKAMSKSKTDSNTAHKPADSNEIRLNKYIANSGICSRRDADIHIAAGNVTVNGKVITEMGYKVLPDDEVRFDGARITPEKKAYVLLNKPKGYATTTSEGKGRTVMDLVANATRANIRPIGRLGRNALGLILFTNDDALVKKFTDSSTGVPRLFHIELEKQLRFEDFKKIKEGLKIEGRLVTVEDISYVEGQPKTQIGLKIKNTGNSSIRSIFGHLNYEIIKLDCVAIAGLTKKDLPRGHWKHLSEQEVNYLKMLP